MTPALLKLGLFLLLPALVIVLGHRLHAGRRAPQDHGHGPVKAYSGKRPDQ